MPQPHRTDMKFPSQALPDPAPAPPPGLEELSTLLISWLKYGVLIAGVIMILICAGMVILGRRNRNQIATEGVLGFVWVLGGLAMASVTAGLVAIFAL